VSAFVELLVAQRAGVVRGEQRDEPAIVLQRHVVQSFRVVASTRRRDEQRVAVVLFEDRAVIAPRTRMRERPLAVGDARDRGADRRVVPDRCRSPAMSIRFENE
jgi:hypothetical protein